MRRPYSPDEDRRLLEGRAQGLTLQQLGEQLGRSAHAIVNRLQILGDATLSYRLKPYAKTTRPCLCCGRPFASEGPHNRLCGRCRYQSDPGDQWRYN